MHCAVALLISAPPLAIWKRYQILLSGWAEKFIPSSTISAIEGCGVSAIETAGGSAQQGSGAGKGGFLRLSIGRDFHPAAEAISRNPVVQFRWGRPDTNEG